MRRFFASRPLLRRGLLSVGVLGLILALFGGLLSFFQPSSGVTMRSSTTSISPLFNGFDSTTVTPEMTPSPSVTTGTTATITPSTIPTSSSLPRFDHVVIVVEENHGYSQIVGSNSAPYINSLAGQGMLFSNSHAITHPSEPNYLDLFSGSDQGVIGDACDPSAYAPPNLGGQLTGAKYTFAGYSEGLAAPGDTSCTNKATGYARKHSPWANFSDTNGPTTNLPYSSFPATTAGYSSLPTVSFVIPNLNNDMHDGTIQQGDTWLQQNMDAYAQWAKTNNSLLIVTWDENDTKTGDATNQVATLFVGQHVQVGTNTTSINHFSVLRTLEDMYGLSPANNAASAADILDVWN